MEDGEQDWTEFNTAIKFSCGWLRANAFLTVVKLMDICGFKESRVHILRL